MRVPDGVRETIRALRAAGHEAYPVGGCVRDLLLSEAGEDVAVHDWDVCTDATPEEMKTALAGHRTIDTGIRHGTITVLLPDGQYEVTTFRVDGTYSDGRHPDSVSFTASVGRDLARRDFTINAMALRLGADGEPAGIIDPFGGREDLERRRLRCVGDPRERFEEDALRILRALRFAGRLGLEIDPATRGAMLEKRALLQRISVERILDELGKILLTEHGWELLRQYPELLTEILPELRPCVGFAQRNPWHRFNVYDHLLFSVGSAPKDLTLRMTMLLHDVGKPAAASTDEAGIDHFYGHGELSAALAEQILRRLHSSNRLLGDVVELVRYHDAAVEPSARVLRRLLNRLGETQLRRLLAVKRADTAAQSQMARERKLPELERCEELLEQIVAERQAFTLRDLRINGRDLIERGVAPGPEIGRRLQRALDAVLDGTIENEREALLAAALADP